MSRISLKSDKFRLEADAEVERGRPACAVQSHICEQGLEGLVGGLESIDSASDQMSIRKQRIETCIGAHINEDAIDWHRLDQILQFFTDRKSTRLNSSHVAISYAVFCYNKQK